MENLNTKPNVIIIYADDLGYGDLSCYGAEDVKTPNIDKLCENGLKFNSAYSTSSVCTPARYSLMTGEYPFRNDKAFILAGDAKTIISKEQYTLPKLFKDVGYTTGIVGKWHLGLGEGDEPINWNTDVNFTPNDAGFDYSFIFPATADRVPCVYMENRKVVNLDHNDPLYVSYTTPFEGNKTGLNSPELLTKLVHSHGHNQCIVNGVGRIGYFKGGEKALWKDEDLAEDFSKKAVSFIDDNKENPFFLYYAVHQPHVPRVPNPRFVGATNLGPRGDVIAELDWCVGEVLNKLEQLDLMENTMIIFSSDNGPVLDDGYFDKAVDLNGKHRPAGPLRGGKYSKFEGGARIPFIVSHKGSMATGVSDALISQADLLSSFAYKFGVELKDGQGVDSENVMDALLGFDPNGREDLIAQEYQLGKMLRKGKWAYLHPSDGRQYNIQCNMETGNSLDPQLYNLDYDISQRENVASVYPEIVSEMAKRVEEICASTQTR